MVKFNKRYFLWAIGIFAVEVAIALYVQDEFIRPYIGDFLVVILLYTAIKSFFDVPYLKTAIAVWLFAILVETLQYFQFVNWLGLSHSKVARVVIGTSFEWADIVAYTLGVGSIILVESIRYKKE